MHAPLQAALSLIERNLVPDFVVQRGIIYRLSQRLNEVQLRGKKQNQKYKKPQMSHAACSVHAALQAALSLIERNLVPDFVIRRGIIDLLSQRLREVLISECSHPAEDSCLTAAKSGGQVCARHAT